MLFSSVTIFLVVLLILAVAFIKFTAKKNNEPKDDLPEAPTPMALPLIGHLHLLGGYEVPYQAFNALAKKYGPVFQLKLGVVKSLVVNGQNNIREVLVTKGSHFDSRPDFERYQRLFGGNKENCKYFLKNFN